VAYCDKSALPEDRENRWDACSKIPGTIELVWNHGSEKEDGKLYNTGNADTTGT
jgi:hypothetical protein